ncbi:hypothetical protein B7494_g2634 [Chlorociboria aeruginascens]|nr:hypothetical protein B7494_g2634 [Chlorociboria aeruginascens]
MARKNPSTWYLHSFKTDSSSPGMTIANLFLYSNTCDGATPDCAECVKLQLQCEKPNADYRFLIHSRQLPNSCEFATLSPCIVLTDVAPGLPTHSHRSSSYAAATGSRGSADLQLGQAARLSKLSPRAALEDPGISQFFSHYIRTIAPWYDLNDSTNTFGIIVTACALDFPVLFRAIIALSSSHWLKMVGSSQEIAFAFYAACVEDLLKALDNSPNFQGEYLAAACLLQLYEILNESIQGPPCHLLGAYSFLNTIHVDLSTWNLAQAGFWNYLREEITIGLASIQPVRIGKDFSHLRDMITCETIGDDMRANLITYILARLVNLYSAFNEARIKGDGHHWIDEHYADWTDLRADLTLWTENLPATFQAFSTAPKTGNIFPSEWLLKPWHVSALQYAATAEILLTLSSPELQNESSSRPIDLVQKLTIRICGIAFTNEDLAATLNGFGPLLFCGRYLTEVDHRTALETMLVNFGKPTGYPMEHNIKQLKDWWTQSSYG